jgi:hypothetical protein
MKQRLEVEAADRGESLAVIVREALRAYFSLAGQEIGAGIENIADGILREDMSRICRSVPKAEKPGGGARVPKRDAQHPSAVAPAPQASTPRPYSSRSKGSRRVKSP